MATYLILNLAVLAGVAILLGRRPTRPSRAWLFMFAVIFVLTLVFDNLLIWLGMYSYAPDKLLGLHVWLAPIEDFMYVVLAALLVPAVWHKTEKRHA